jgi:putative endonuclease
MSAGPAARPGQAGEDLACDYLRRQGLRVVERNFRCRAGEIDVVAREGETWVFVEVKERSGVSHGSAVEAVTAVKIGRVVRAARVYAATRGLWECSLRFDVVAIDWGPDGARIRHERGAFGEG